MMKKKIINGDCVPVFGNRYTLRDMGIFFDIIKNWLNALNIGIHAYQLAIMRAKRVKYVTQLLLIAKDHDDDTNHDDAVRIKSVNDITNQNDSL